MTKGGQCHVTKCPGISLGGDTFRIIEVIVISYLDLPRSVFSTVQARVRSGYEIKVDIHYQAPTLNRGCGHSQLVQKLTTNFGKLVSPSKH